MPNAAGACLEHNGATLFAMAFGVFLLLYFSPNDGVGYLQKPSFDNVATKCLPFRDEHQPERSVLTDDRGKFRKRICLCALLLRQSVSLLVNRRCKTLGGVFYVQRTWIASLRLACHGAEIKVPEALMGARCENSQLSGLYPALFSSSYR